MVFLGGAVLANIVRTDFAMFLNCLLTTLQMADKEDMWISKQEWEEQGPRVLEKLGKR